MSEPVEPKPAIPLDEPIQPRMPIPWWRWVVAALLAPIIFISSQLPMVLLAQQFNDIPDRWQFVPVIGEFSIGLAVTIWALRGVVRPKPKKQRGFSVLQKKPHR